MTHTQTHIVTLSIVLSVLLFGVVNVSTAAAQAHVESNVSVSASTGSQGIDGADGVDGKDGKDGRDGKNITTGSSEAHVSVETIINGEVVQDFEEHIFAEDGEDIFFEEEFFFESDTEAEAETETEISAENDTVSESGEVKDESVEEEKPQPFLIVWLAKAFQYVASLFS